MGLDMFIIRKKLPEETVGDDICYWRKAYPIMDWFENYYHDVGNLEEIKINKGTCKGLQYFCEQVIKVGNFSPMDNFENVLWTTERELNERFDHHMEYVKRTYKWVSNFLETNDDWENLVFVAWW